MAGIDWRQATAAARWENEYGDFAGELEAATKPLPHDTRYAELRSRRMLFAKDVSRLGSVGLNMPSPPEEPPVAE